jgi:hypothetical protein
MTLSDDSSDDEDQVATTTRKEVRPANQEPNLPVTNSTSPKPPFVKPQAPLFPLRQIKPTKSRSNEDLEEFVSRRKDVTRVTSMRKKESETKPEWIEKDEDDVVEELCDSDAQPEPPTTSPATLSPLKKRVAHVPRHPSRSSSSSSVIESPHRKDDMSPDPQKNRVC